jgi:Ni,Fe-hydrogenase I cytochrome b subunit
MKSNLDAERAVHWIFTITTIVFVFSGYGITEYRIVEAITLGLLPKALAFQIHMSLGPLFLVLLASHVYLVLRRRTSAKKTI